MIIDKRLQVSSQQALSATAPSTDVIDVGQQSRIIGPGEPLWWVIAARVGLAGTSPTLIVAIQADDNSGFSSATTLFTSQTFAAADVPTGKILTFPMTFNNERFLRLNYTLGGTTPTVTVDAWLTNQDPQSWISYADAI